MSARKKHRRLDFIERQMPFLVALLAISALLYFLQRSQTAARRNSPPPQELTEGKDAAGEKIARAPAGEPVPADLTDPTKEFLEAVSAGDSDEKQPEVLVDPTKPVLAETATAAQNAPSPAELELDLKLQSSIPYPVIKPLEEIVNGWRAVPPNAFPAEVHLKSPLTFESHPGGRKSGKSTLAAGSAVVPLALEGAQLTVARSRDSGERIAVPVDDTDFKKLVQERYDNFVRHARENVLARRAAEKRRILNAEAKEQALSQYGDGSDPRFDPMKESIRSGGAGMFQLEAAESWRWSGKESVDGVEYDTGLVMMVSESAFGSTKREIKALLQAGKVVRWVDAVTGKPL